MNPIINPGSRIAASDGIAWTNTYETAAQEAEQWLGRMQEDGLCDIDLQLPGLPLKDEGRWAFQFKHTITGVIVTLEMHGISSTQAYMKEHIFLPRVYWNGCSSSNPKLEDWATPGFTAVKTFRRNEEVEAVAS